MSAARNVLLMLPMEKSVVAVSGVCGDRIAAPETPVQIEPSGKTIAAEAPGYLPPLRTVSRAAWSAALLAGSSRVANEAGSASCVIGTGTIEATSAAVGEFVASAEVGEGVAASDPVAAGVGVGLPHAATATTMAMAETRPAGRRGRDWRMAGVTTGMMHQRAGSAPHHAAPAFLASAASTEEPQQEEEDVHEFQVVRAVKMMTPTIEMIVSSAPLLRNRFSTMATSSPHVAMAR